MRKKSLLSLSLFVLLVLFLFLVNNKSNKNILSVVLPHHNLVKTERLEFWKDVIKESGIDADGIKKVIIVGPDHFGSIKTNITYDNTSWTTYDDSLKNFFVRPEYFSENYVLNTKLIKNDHAIANFIGEVHEYFKNALFVPFIIGEKVKFSELQYLSKYIDRECSNNCILIASVDFSHYVTLDVANIQDSSTIKLLSEKGIKENVLNMNNTIEADSPASLYVIQEYARKRGMEWKLFNHTNSAFGNKETTDTTSHVFGAYIYN